MYNISIDFVGVKCKICKFRYHKGCLSKVPLHCTKNAAIDDIEPTFDGMLSIHLMHNL